MARSKGSKNKKQVKVETSKGLGDIVESITEATGVKKIVEVFTNGKDCGCDKRKEQLNDIKVKGSLKVNCMSEEQYNLYDEFVNNRKITLLGSTKASGTIEDKQINMLSEMYANLTNQPAYKICRGCSNSKPLIRIIEVLDQVYNIYKEELNKK